jgi:adenylyltransferase/sulfurtransferase
MKKITPEELSEWIKEDKPFVLIDVRENWEREAYNIGGEHIPLGELISRKSEIPQTGNVVLYCEKGIRSSIVIQRLEQLGYDNLYNLEGGMNEWKKGFNY